MRHYINKSVYLVVITSIILAFGCGPEAQGPASSVDVLPGSSRLSDLLGDVDRAGYAMAIEPRAFDFPQDHGPHPLFRNEWWYFTGNLDAQGGERFGFELTFFRFSLSPGTESDIESEWRTNQVYIAHFAISDVDSDQFHVAQKYSRGAAGLAGATANPFSVWLDDWRVFKDPSNESWRLRARDNDVGIELSLVSLKAPVLNGVNGLSQKSDQPGNASYYYSIPRLHSSGTIEIDDRVYEVDGLAWLDREWSSSALSADQRGWDWFALQLSDGSDLMFYQLRQNDDTVDPNSAGTWIDPAGNSTHLSSDDVTVSVTDYWTSERGSRYPAAWSIAIDSLDLIIDVKPVMTDQELVTNIRYWEGAVDVVANLATEELTGRGYVELTGYAED